MSLTADGLLGEKTILAREEVNEKLKEHGVPKYFYGRSIKMLNELKAGSLNAIGIALIFSTIITIYLAIRTKGFGPMQDPSYYTTFCSAMYTPAAVATLVAIAFWLGSNHLLHKKEQKKFERIELETLIKKIEKDMQNEITLLERLQKPYQTQIDSRKAKMRELFGDQSVS